MYKETMSKLHCAFLSPKMFLFFACSLRFVYFFGSRFVLHFFPSLSHCPRYFSVFINFFYLSKTLIWVHALTILRSWTQNGFTISKFGAHELSAFPFWEKPLIFFLLLSFVFTLWLLFHQVPKQYFLCVAVAVYFCCYSPLVFIVFIFSLKIIFTS